MAGVLTHQRAIIHENTVERVLTVPGVDTHLAVSLPAPALQLGERVPRWPAVVNDAECNPSSHLGFELPGDLPAAPLE